STRTHGRASSARPCKNGCRLRASTMGRSMGASAPRPSPPSTLISTVPAERPLLFHARSNGLTRASVPTSEPSLAATSRAMIVQHNDPGRTWRKPMRRFLTGAGLGAAALALLTTAALAQTKEFKIGVIFDETGPFAGGGSKANLIGTKLAID